MTRMRDRVLLPLVLVTALMGGCGTIGGEPRAPGSRAGGDTNSQPEIGGKAPDTSYEIGSAPDPQDQIPEKIDVPPAFPVFTEQAQARVHVRDMANIHVAATKTRQIHEVPPQVTAVKGAYKCKASPGQKRSTRWVGDTAKGNTIVAACYNNGKWSIYFAPVKLYGIRQTEPKNGMVADLIREAMIDYLAGVTQEKAGLYDKLTVACTAGRMIGGLRDHNYIAQRFAGTLHVSASDRSEYAQIFRRARDEGYCAPRYFASNG